MALWLYGCGNIESARLIAGTTRWICTHRISPACGIARFLSRFARCAGLVHLRQTFVLRCHDDDGWWPLRAEASSNPLFGGAAWRHARDNLVPLEITFVRGN